MKVVSVVLLIVSFALAFIAAKKGRDAEQLSEGGVYTSSEVRRNEVLDRLGLPPDPPKAKAMVEDEEEEETMRPFHAENTEAFASKGYIGVHGEQTSGPLLGFLDCHKLERTKENATLYAFIQAGPVMEMRVVGTQYRLAVTSGPIGADLEMYSKNFHLPRHTLFSSIPGAGPNHDKVQAYLYETSVFTLDPDENEIEVQWVNRNGEYVTTEIVLMNNRIYFTGDIRAFRTYTSSKADHVVFKWYPVD
ncbi:hypothetical protein D9611_004339 [Ephemerocybe angulata]|uniref:Uncharacterized protein n=1 Tax=Ephemerocybe angulata TaxID=980116 RepID=A0A8H5F5G5_9AGAR|nr:hypothetical protein D9611_004339 [Tulosesus angulatus]